MRKLSVAAALVCTTLLSGCAVYEPAPAYALGYVYAPAPAVVVAPAYYGGYYRGGGGRYYR